MSQSYGRWRRIRTAGWHAVCAGDYRMAALLLGLEGRAWRAMSTDERAAEHDRLAHGRPRDAQMSLL